MGNAIGSEAMVRVLDVTDELRACVRDEFEPFEGVYRINDFGEYVSEGDWERVWAGRPSWWPKAWMLADNGQFSAEQVGRLSVGEIEVVFGSAALGLGDSLDDYAASWDASREDPDGCTWPAWDALGLDVRVRYVGLELAQCAVAMLDRVAESETDIHDVMPEAWEIAR